MPERQLLCPLLPCPPILFVALFCGVGVSLGLAVLGRGGESQAAPGRQAPEGTNASPLAFTPLTPQTLTSARCQTSASTNAGTAWAATAASAPLATGFCPTGRPATVSVGVPGGCPCPGGMLAFLGV